MRLACGSVEAAKVAARLLLRHFQHGAILYSGASVLPTADPRVLAVPLSELWTL